VSDDPIFTLDQVADQFQFTPRQMRELLNRLLRQGRIRVMRRGRDIRLDTAMVAQLKEAISTPCPSASLPVNPPVPSRSKEKIQSPEREYKDALAATTPSLQRKRPHHGKPLSSAAHGMENVLALVRSRRQ
jgi:hypothetical protein